MWDGKVMFAVIVAIILSAIVGRIVASGYRRTVLELMSTSAPPTDDAPAASAGNAAAPQAPAAEVSTTVTPAHNRRARLRLGTGFVAISLAIGFSQAWFTLTFVYTEGGFGILKLAVMGLGYSWVMMPALGLLWRWSWLRSALATVAYMVVVGSLVWWRSTENQQLTMVLGWLGFTILPPLIAFALAAGGRARATGPYLLPVFLLLAGASIAGTDLLQHLVQPGFSSTALGEVTELLGAETVLSLFVFVPWLAMAWPAWRGARWLAEAYRAKRFSEPLYLLGGYWMVALLFEALAASHSIGVASLGVLACWLWIPVGMLALRDWLAAPRAAPTLLVLRVFRRDAEVQALFDAVVERWRYSGKACLIAGTDLALRTLEPDELFAFVSGRLRERFITGDADLARRLESFDLTPDPDGRFRVNEFYCTDSTWKRVLDALVERADMVLMDLRGLRAENLGCLHELQVLARAHRARRIVLLLDERTDRKAIHDAIGDDDRRFMRYETGRPGHHATESVLELLLGATPTDQWRGAQAR